MRRQAQRVAIPALVAVVWLLLGLTKLEHTKAAVFSRLRHGFSLKGKPKEFCAPHQGATLRCRGAADLPASARSKQRFCAFWLHRACGQELLLLSAILRSARAWQGRSTKGQRSQSPERRVLHPRQSMKPFDLLTRLTSLTLSSRCHELGLVGQY